MCTPTRKKNALTLNPNQNSTNTEHHHVHDKTTPKTPAIHGTTHFRCTCVHQKPAGTFLTVTPGWAVNDAIWLVLIDRVTSESTRSGRWLPSNQVKSWISVQSKKRSKCNSGDKVKLQTGLALNRDVIRSECFFARFIGYWRDTWASWDRVRGIWGAP